MSQHYFDTTHQGTPVSVMMGFDRQLQGFFMVVGEDVETEDGDELLYNNLTDSELIADGGMAHTVSYFLDKLTDLGISLPKKMVDEVMADGTGNVGNRIVQYGPAGEVVMEHQP